MGCSHFTLSIRLNSLHFFACRELTGQRFLETDAESITKMTG